MAELKTIDEVVKETCEDRIKECVKNGAKFPNTEELFLIFVIRFIFNRLNCGYNQEEIIDEIKNIKEDKLNWKS
jgi:hypothetical protein